MTEEVKVNYVDHISIAVKDLDENIRVIYFQVGQTAVELMEDIDGTGEVAKFIERRGEGVMVLSFNVDNCFDSLGILKKNGAQVIDKEPRFVNELNRYFAFIHPKACHGILTEVIDGTY
jgi:methylmalonyl-CoA/ethylmalonyl-CoA epimerase